MNYRTRQEWGASYDVNQRALMTGLPVGTIFIHHTVTTPTDDPDRDMRQVEQIDISRFGVPSYSWCIHPRGVILEGMSIHRGAHTINNQGQSLNNVAFGISFIGNYENMQPSALAMLACRQLIFEYIIPHNWLKNNWVIRGHRDVYATACPGANLYPRIQELTVPPSPVPPSKEELDMTPGQCRDKEGHKWHFVVDDNRRCYSFRDGKDNGPLLAADPGWTSGFDAMCEDDGMITVCGRNSAGRLAQVLFTPGGAPPQYNEIGGHIYPP